MVHIILFILKIIGIILASIIGILLFLILIVLLVPIRYQIYGEKREDMKLEGKVTWLLHLIYLRVTYESNKSIIKLRIFGRLFYDSQNVKNSKNKIKNGKKKAKYKKVKNRNIKDKETENNKIEKTSKTNESGIADEVGDNVIGKINIENIKDTVDKAKEAVTEKVKEEFIDEPIDKAMDHSKREANKKESDKLFIHPIGDSIDETKEKDEDTYDTGEYNKTKKGFFYKLKAFLRKLLNIPKKIVELLIKVKNSIKKVYYIIIGFLEKWHKIRAFLQNEINKKGLKNSFLSLRKIFKHIRPRKLTAEVEFGTGDPCSTGQLLGGLAVFYGYYGEAVQIIPNFETAMLEGSILCKGRIRLFTLLIICIKLILNKEFRTMIENFKAFKEEL